MSGEESPRGRRVFFRPAVPTVRIFTDVNYKGLYCTSDFKWSFARFLKSFFHKNFLLTNFLIDCSLKVVVRALNCEKPKNDTPALRELSLTSRCFKGTVSQDFWVLVFSINSSSWSQLLWDDFDFWPNIHGEIQICNRFRGVIKIHAPSIQRSIYWKIFSSYSPCYMIQVWSFGKFFEELFLLELWLPSFV